MIKKIIELSFSLLRHLVALGIVLTAFWPLAKLYYQSYPPLGADFYQFVNFAAFIKKNFSWLLFSWKPDWFSGHPMIFDYGLLHSYLVLPLTNFFTVANASRIYLLGTLALYSVFTYFLFWQLTENRLFSLLLTGYMSWATNLYTAIFSGGTNGFGATQMFLPLIFWLVVKYFDSQNRRFLVLASLALGTSFWGHAGMALTLIGVPAFLMVLFWTDKKTALLSWQKAKDILLFFVPAILMGSLALYPVIYPIFYWRRETISGYVGLSTRAYPEAFSQFFKTNQPFLFLLLFVALALVVATGRLAKIKKSITFWVLAAYFTFFEFLFAIGRNPLGNASSPDRTHFVFSLILGCLLAILWQALGPKFGFKVSKLFRAGFRAKFSFGLRTLVLVLMVAGLGMAYYYQNYLSDSWPRTSVIPTNINNTLLAGDQAAVKAVIPDWFDQNETNYRFYEPSNSVNVWWNILYDLPMVKGCYYTGTSQFTADWLYWADLAFIGEIVAHFNAPVKVAKNSALFLLDWYAVKYFDNHPAPYGLADYLTDVPGLVENEVGLSQTNFVEIADQFTTPIIRPVRVPTLLVVGPDHAYDIVLRVLGMENLNSRYLIPLHGPQHLDEIDPDELKNFDAIFLYDYRYQDREVWELLVEYVKAGGSLIIETGTEVKESDIGNTPELFELPEVFPVSQTGRQNLGSDWDLSHNDQTLLTGVKTSDFSPLIYEQVAWQLSASEPEAVRQWGRVVLSQAGRPVLVVGGLGQGQVIWSGMNLPYHIQTYLNFEESRLLRNLIASVIDLEVGEINSYQVERFQPENIKVKAQEFSGVLVKENHYRGWQANSGSGLRLPIYDAGLDFIYVRVPAGETEINLNFRGAIVSWVLFVLGTIALIFCLLFLVQGGKFFKKIIPTARLEDRVKKWWEKDEE